MICTKPCLRVAFLTRYTVMEKEEAEENDFFLWYGLCFLEFNISVAICFRKLSRNACRIIKRVSLDPVKDVTWILNSIFCSVTWKQSLHTAHPVCSSLSSGRKQGNEIQLIRLCLTASSGLHFYGCHSKRSEESWCLKLQFEGRTTAKQWPTCSNDMNVKTNDNACITSCLTSQVTLSSILLQSTIVCLCNQSRMLKDNIPVLVEELESSLADSVMSKTYLCHRCSDSHIHSVDDASWHHDDILEYLGSFDVFWEFTHSTLLHVYTCFGNTILCSVTTPVRWPVKEQNQQNSFVRSMEHGGFKVFGILHHEKRWKYKTLKIIHMSGLSNEITSCPN